jgi:hypothetical protein
VRAWSARTGVGIGAVVPVRVLHDLTKDWYRGRLDPDWRPRTPADAQRRFAAAGLTGAFWSLR